MKIRIPLFIILFVGLASALTNVSTCVVISSPGAYLLNTSLTGAPLNASEVTDLSWACIKIASSDVVFDCSGYNITNNGTTDAAGIVINGSSGVAYTNVTIRNCPRIFGYNKNVYIHRSSYDVVQNVTAYNSNIDYGFYASNSHHINFTNNFAYSNRYGFYITSWGSGQNIFTNNYVFGSNGFHITRSNYNDLINNTARNTNGYGFHIEFSSYTDLINNTAHCFPVGGGYDGFLLYSSSHSVLINNTSRDNPRHGFTLHLDSDDNVLLNNTAHSNDKYGIYIFKSTNNNITNTHLYDNTQADFYITTGATPKSVYLYNLTIDNPSGNFENYTSLNVSDTVGANTAYSIKWTANTHGLPPGYVPFVQKFVNIANASGSVSIDSITWHWNDSELFGYNETEFELWKYNSSGWTMLNNTPDTSANTLSLTDMNPASDYGILQNNASECMVISSPGAYLLNANIAGAPIDASEVYDINQACIKIATSNVLLDCSGYNITNDGTLNAAGVVINGSASTGYSNVTIRNCPGISSYEWGVYAYYSSRDVIRNVTAYNNTNSGFYLRVNNDSILLNNTARNNTRHGFFAEHGSNTTFIGNNAHDNRRIGFLIWSNPRTTLASNGAYGNSESGFLVGSSSCYTNLTNNTAYNNYNGLVVGSSSNHSNCVANRAYGNIHDGFYTIGAEYLGFTDNIAYNNGRSGFFNEGPDRGTFVNNRAYNNTLHGFFLWSSLYNNLTNNTAYSNNDYGFYLSSSDYNNLTSNSAYNNSISFRIESSDYNNLTNNSAYNNTVYGVQLTSNSNNNNLINNSAYGNNRGFLLEANSDSNTFSNNTACNNTIGFFIIQGSNNIFTSNFADNNTWDGFGIEDANNTFTNNFAYGNGWNGFSLGSSLYNNLTDNVAYNNTLHGFFLWLSLYNNLTNNTAYSNNDYGFYLSSSDYNNLTSNSAYNNSGNGMGISSSDGNQFAGSLLYGNGFSGGYYDIRISSDSNNNVFRNTTIYTNKTGYYAGRYVYQQAAANPANNFTNLMVCYNETIGCVSWGFLSLSGASLNSSDFIAAPLFVSLDSHAAQEFNESANVTILTPFCPTTMYYKEGFPVTKEEIVSYPRHVCSACTVHSCVGNTVLFSVPSFTGYAAGSHANLSIFDQNDSEAPSPGPAYDNESVRFYANYSNSTSGAPIGDSVGNCSIMFSDSPGVYFMSYNSSSTLWEYNRSFSAAGYYEWNVTCNSTTDYETLFAPDNITILLNNPPYCTGHLEYPPSPVTYSPSATYQFNSTWLDAESVVDSVWIEHNFIGVLGNYSATGNVSDEWYYDYGALPAGMHSVKWYANDTHGKLNDTSACHLTYMVNQAVPAIVLNASPGWNVTYNATTNVSCYSPNGITVSLYRNGTLTGSGAYVEDIATLSAGTYNYMCNTTGNENYTAAEEQDILAIAKADALVNLTLNGIDGDITVGLNGNVLVNGTLVIPSAGHTELYIDGLLVNSSDSGFVGYLLAGVTAPHTILFVYNETENYTQAMESHTVTVWLPSGNGGDENMHLSYSFACPGNILTVTSTRTSGHPLGYTTIRLYYGDAFVGKGETGDDGTVTFVLSQNGTYKAKGTRDGHHTKEISFLITLCEEKPPVPEEEVPEEEEGPAPAGGEVNITPSEELPAEVPEELPVIPKEIPEEEIPGEEIPEEVPEEEPEPELCPLPLWLLLALLLLLLVLWLARKLMEKGRGTGRRR